MIPSQCAEEIFCQIPVMPFNKIIKRSFLLESNIKFQDINNSNDVYFGKMVVAAARRVTFLPRAYVHYRYNTGIQISSKRYKRPECICDAFQKIYEDLNARGLWQSFKQAYFISLLEALMGALNHIDNPKSFLQYVRNIRSADLGLLSRRREEFKSYKLYGRYQFFMVGGNAVLNNKVAILKYGIHLFIKGDFTSLFWLCGHYVKNAIKYIRS